MEFDIMQDLNTIQAKKNSYVGRYKVFGSWLLGSL